MTAAITCLQGLTRSCVIFEKNGKRRTGQSRQHSTPWLELYCYCGPFEKITFYNLRVKVLICLSINQFFFTVFFVALPVCSFQFVVAFFFIEFFLSLEIAKQIPWPCSQTCVTVFEKINHLEILSLLPLYLLDKLRDSFFWHCLPSRLN